MRARSAPLVLLAIFLLPLGAPPTLAHSNDDPDHGHATLTLTTEDLDAAGRGRLLYNYTGAFVVQGTGIRTIEVPLAGQAELLGFHTPGDLGRSYTETDPQGRRTAIYVWETEGPEPGTVLANVSMEAAEAIDPTTDQAITWGPLADALTVRVNVPESHAVIGAGLMEQIHGTPPGRRIWHDVNHGSESVQLTIRPAASGTDPAFAAPPSPIGGFLVLLLLALLSGGAWVAAKKLERLGEQAKKDEPPKEV